MYSLTKSIITTPIIAMFIWITLGGTVDEPQEAGTGRDRQTETRATYEGPELSGETRAEDEQGLGRAEDSDESGSREISGTDQGILATSGASVLEQTNTPANRVSYCESGQRNVENPVSSASGYFQFIDSTWRWVTGLEPPASSHSFQTQLEAFHTLWDEGRGSSHWAPSQSCWRHNEPWDHYDR